MRNIIRGAFYSAILVAGMILGLMTSLYAEDVDCENWEDGPQQKMNYCSYVEYQKLDKVLNQTWAKIKPEIKANDAYNPPELRGWWNAVLEAQRAWILYRDNHCESEGFKARGGTLEPLLVSGCKARMTRQRIEELKLLVQEGF